MILLDTHVLVWSLEGNAKLGKKTRQILASSATKLSVSAISFWEISMLVERNRLTISSDTALWRKEVIALGVKEIAIDGEIGIEASRLANFHADPADRLIVATALRHNLPILTADERILAWKGGASVIDARR